MLQYNPTVSGSLTVTGTISATQGITGSFSGSIAGLPTDTLAFSSSLSTRITNTELTSSEYVSTSGSLSTRVTAAEATSSAFVAASGSLAGRITSNEARTGSFATTGSNRFDGSQTITGSLTATGTIVAQTLVVQTITSSVDFVTGSTRYGSTTGNTHEFTGSVLVSGSQTMNGNVGIGTITPQGNLEVVGLSYFTRSSQSTLLNPNYGGAGTHSQIQVVGNMALAFATNGDNERMRITSGGNVGIGTTSPVGGGGASDRTLSINAATGAAAFLTGLINGTRYSTLFTAVDSVVLETNAAIPLVFNTNSNEKMRITSGGNIGIGITTPGKRLEISEDNSSTTTTTGLKITNWSITTNTRAGIIFQNYDNIGAAIWSRRTGTTAGELIFGTNPGAGTTAESAIVERMRIDNVGTATFASTTYNIANFNSSYGQANINIQNGGTTFAVFGSGASTTSTSGPNDVGIGTGGLNNAIVFATSTGYTERMRITSGGNVGIGTTNPGSKLTVVGSTGIDGTLSISQPNAASNIQLSGNGNEQGASHNYKIVKHYPVVSAGNKLIIPFVDQGNLNSNTIVRIFGHSARFNSPSPVGFTADFGIGHLNTLSGLQIYSSTGNVSGIAINGMNIEISFTSAYTSATANGIYATIEYMTNVPSYSINVSGITMN